MNDDTLPPGVRPTAVLGDSRQAQERGQVLFDPQAGQRVTPDNERGLWNKSFVKCRYFMIDRREVPLQVRGVKEHVLSNRVDMGWEG